MKTTYKIEDIIGVLVMVFILFLLSSLIYGGLTGQIILEV